MDKVPPATANSAACKLKPLPLPPLSALCVALAPTPLSASQICKLSL